MIVKIRFDYDFKNKEGQDVKGSKYSVVIDGVEYSVGFDTWNSLDGFVFIKKHVFTDKTTGVTRYIYEKGV